MNQLATIETPAQAETDLVSSESAEATPPLPRFFPRPQVRGKFLYVGTEKFYIRGVTYGPFAPDACGSEYHNAKTVSRDFALMAAAGINAIRTYTVPPRWLLDLAQRHNLRVLIGLPWEQHIAFLDQPGRPAQIIQRIRQMVRTCSGHPAILAYAVGNEIPASIVRWHGARRVERFIYRLYRAVKQEDPSALVTYVNYPTTEYLHLPFLDFIAFNVYLETPDKLKTYLAKLHNHANERPLILAEIGLDSLRHGSQTQAESLTWQIRTAFAGGCAGVFVFSWTDEWFRGGMEITDWGFGLTDRQRRPKPALEAVRRAFQHVPFPPDLNWPFITVVVCTYNGVRTLRDTCEGLAELKYPNFEVLVVDDGSTQDIASIVRPFGFRIIRTENQGLSRARNVGLEHARGQIVAFLDDDARPDPHWLHYLAWTYMTSSHVAVGGPNIAPPGDGHIADCVANAPGGPIHVLLSDEIAEHIPGCNLSVRRDAALAIGGFDGRFRIAGDDVDFCWRLQEQGWTIGFSPAAMVWHHRRNSIRAYLKQQLNYGRAEALLEKKWPGRYNAAGHIPWMGRIYGKGILQVLRLSPPRIYQGTWGLAPFQSLYEPPPGLLSLLPAMPDWYLVIAALGGLSLLGLLWPPLFAAFPLLLAAVGAPLCQAALGGLRASFTNKEKSRWITWGKHALTALLHLLQPIVRFYGRVELGLHPLRRRGARHWVRPRRLKLTRWHETWASPEQYLLQIEDALEKVGAAVRRGGDFDRWDLRVSGGLLSSARLRMAVEEHGQGRQQLLFCVWPTWSPAGLVLIVLLALLAFFAWRDWAYVTAGVLAFCSLALAFKSIREAGFAVGAIVEAVQSTPAKVPASQSVSPPHSAAAPPQPASPPPAELSTVHAS